jgi:hypothetical protein
MPPTDPSAPAYGDRNRRRTGLIVLAVVAALVLVVVLHLTGVVGPG